MTRNKAGFLFRPYEYSKVRLNYLLDRVIDFCDMILMDAYQLPWPRAQNAAKGAARYIGDISWLLRAFPRLSAYKLGGKEWTIIFVGGDRDLEQVRHLFFSGEVDQQEIGRIALWKLSTQTQQWLAEGIDLVICELGRIYPNRPQAPIAFTVLTWVNQVLAIPESLETLIAGKKFATTRHRLNKAQRNGFSFRFSQSKTDFDFFHHHMYLPYVKARHGHLAIVGRYQDQWQRWFTRGGLVLVIQNDKPVAGVLCYMANDTCVDVERGVLGADLQLFKQGIETIITWYAITWGHGQGAKTYNMGGSCAWRSNGSFDSKRRWGAQVARRRKIYGTWAFLAQNLPSSLQNHINQLGFISEIDEKFYGVLISSNADSTAEVDINEELLAAKRQGLDGLVAISAHARPIVHTLATQSTN
jgi:hypothetical protein